MTPALPQNPPVKYSLPLVAMILSIVGICLCPTALVGAILGIVAWVRISKEPHLPGKGFAIAATFIPLALIPIVGIQAAIAIPNFIKFQARSKQSECKMNLKMVFTAQKTLKANDQPFADQFDTLGVSIERGNRYSYFLTDTAVVPADTQRFPAISLDTYAAGLLQQGIEVGVSPDGFTAACVGNIDNDDVLDIWTISSEDRTGPKGELVPAGVPVNEVNDVIEG